MLKSREANRQLEHARAQFVLIGEQLRLARVRLNDLWHTCGATETTVRTAMHDIERLRKLEETARYDAFASSITAAVATDVDEYKIRCALTVMSALSCIALFQVLHASAFGVSTAIGAVSALMVWSSNWTATYLMLDASETKRDAISVSLSVICMLGALLWVPTWFDLEAPNLEAPKLFVVLLGCIILGALSLVVRKAIKHLL